MVVEADESDGSFLTLAAPTIAVVTNIDAEHMEHYRDLRQGCLRRCVRPSSSRAIPFYGFGGLVSRTIPKCRRSRRARSKTAASSSPTASNAASRRALFDNVRVEPDAIAIFDHGASARARRRRAKTEMADLRLADARPPQRFKTRSAAIAVARELGASEAQVRSPTRSPSFGGVKRRFSHVGDWNGAAHHRRLRPPPRGDPPPSCRAPRKTSVRRPRHRRCMQPHRYSRLQQNCSRILPAASTTPTWWRSHRFSQPAKIRSKASRRRSWCPG